ncbi:MAG TPA: type II secretion system minor pseudopilin GspI [Steroidobacter sp.]|uniref:type II secretion system minor pseudopilin GspI n=1 Tax=Steroidobacter sp. TaxID=1978227 RepID=UPI002EDA7538
MRAHKYPNQGSGFTLIEVLVALVVVGLGMLAVIQTVSQTANNSSYMREKTIAHWIAMNQLTQVRLQPSAPAIDKSSDEVEMAGRDWRWTMVVTQTPVESIRRIEVRVRPSEAPETSSLAFVTGFYGTAVAPAGTVSLNWSATSQSGQGPGGQNQRGGDQGDQQDSETNPPPQPELEPGEPVPTPEQESGNPDS